ncbi:hypothetical protein BT93_J0262 [Corymbia citriodora subsp. variegata]|nr:hypothetical protein BT93_J0262 [Corymbia citriodora subsp. variegata]
MEKSGGAGKKRARRTSAAVPGGGGGRDRNPDAATPGKQATNMDVFRVFAEKVRDHKDLEHRWAFLQETRVEYFRGKDFVSFLQNHPELKDILGSDQNLEVEDIGNALLRKKLLIRCGHVVKTLRPGKKKLSTWPAHLRFLYISLIPSLVAVEMGIMQAYLVMQIQEQVFSDNDAFFAWTFEKRHPLWQTLLSFSWLVLTLAICLFPVYPHRCKILILYSCAGVLLLILSLLFVRAAIFGALCIIFGERVWFFPNILAEEATLGELCRFWPKKDEEERPKWTTRLFYAMVAVVVISLLRHHAAEEAARARFGRSDGLAWPRVTCPSVMAQVRIGLA